MNNWYSRRQRQKRKCEFCVQKQDRVKEITAGELQTVCLLIETIYTKAIASGTRRTILVARLLPFASNRSAQTFLRLFSHSKRICLASKTCTFGRRNMYVWPAKRVRLASWLERSPPFGDGSIFHLLLQNFFHILETAETLKL